MGVYAAWNKGMATSGTGGTYLTFIALKAAAGEYGRLRKLVLNGSSETPTDQSIHVRVTVADQTTDGTSTAFTPKALQSLMNVSLMTCGVTFTAEPTTVNTTTGIIWQGGFNSRGILQQIWTPDMLPTWGNAATLIVQATCGTSNAVKLDSYLEWEE